MSKYKSCFISIDLPYPFNIKIRQGLYPVVERYVPEIKEKEPEIPHMALYYLGRQTEAELDATAEAAQSLSYLLVGQILQAGGFGLSETDYPALYLPVNDSPQIKDFRERLGEVLPDSTKQRSLPFNPHITLTELIYIKSLRQLQRPDCILRTMLERVRWQVPVTQVTIRGNHIGDMSRLRIIN
jgi:2'-5' RNA ligase